MEEEREKDKKRGVGCGETPQNCNGPS